MIIDGMDKGIMMVDIMSITNEMDGNTSVYVDILKNNIVEYIDKAIEAMKNT